MKYSLLVCALLIANLCTSAQDSVKVKELERRVNNLEKRMANNEQTPEAKRMAEVARERVATDKEKYSRDEIDKAEHLYQRANSALRDDKSKAILDSVVALYPKLNRAGCAQLYRAQQEYGAEKERLLISCISQFADCFYLDGTQVGPLATLYLAYYYKRTGKEADAQRLFKKVRKEYSTAVGHDGKLLIEKLP